MYLLLQQPITHSGDMYEGVLVLGVAFSSAARQGQAVSPRIQAILPLPDREYSWDLD